jgi:DNA-directed RNA polymerase specialized sigma24 family protein
MRRLNPAQIDLLTQRYLAGRTVYELGAEFGIARQTVSLVLKRNGVPMRMQGLREEQRGEVTALRDQGWSYARLGEQFKVDPWTVRNFLVRGVTRA